MSFRLYVCFKLEKVCPTSFNKKKKTTNLITVEVKLLIVHHVTVCSNVVSEVAKHAPRSSGRPPGLR